LAKLSKKKNQTEGGTTRLFEKKSAAREETLPSFSFVQEKKFKGDAKDTLHLLEMGRSSNTSSKKKKLEYGQGQKK